MDEKKLKKVVPVGKLFSQGRDYFLLHPYPVARDFDGQSSWQAEGTDRWVCVPNKVIGQAKDGTDVFSVARHVVTNSYAVEYVGGMPEIYIMVERFGLDEQEVEQTEVEPDPSEIWLDPRV